MAPVFIRSLALVAVRCRYRHGSDPVGEFSFLRIGTGPNPLSCARFLVSLEKPREGTRLPQTSLPTPAPRRYFGWPCATSRWSNHPPYVKRTRAGFVQQNPLLSPTASGSLLKIVSLPKCSNRKATPTQRHSR